MEVEKLANDLRGLCFHQIGAGALAEHLIKLGYRPVEPVQLEVLGYEEINRVEITERKKEGFDETEGYHKVRPMDYVKAGSQATIVHNEAKGQLYRVKPE